MKAFLLSRLVEVLISLLTPDVLKKFVDTVLDFIEDYVAGTETDMDDRIILPLVKAVRITFDIPDNDNETDTDKALQARRDRTSGG